jgi:hypothetical protein
MCRYGTHPHPHPDPALGRGNLPFRPLPRTVQPHTYGVVGGRSCAVLAWGGGGVAGEAAGGGWTAQVAPQGCSVCFPALTDLTGSQTPLIHTHKGGADVFSVGIASCTFEAAGVVGGGGRWLVTLNRCATVGWPPSCPLTPCTLPPTHPTTNRPPADPTYPPTIPPCRAVVTASAPAVPVGGRSVMDHRASLMRRLMVGAGPVPGGPPGPSPFSPSSGAGPGAHVCVCVCV